MLLSVLGSFFLFANPLFAKDVTALVVLETDLDERIARFCHDHCQGNQRVGRLLRVTVHGIGPHSFTVRADAMDIVCQELSGPFIARKRHCDAVGWEPSTASEADI